MHWVAELAFIKAGFVPRSTKLSRPPQQQRWVVCRLKALAHDMNPPPYTTTTPCQSAGPPTHLFYQEGKMKACWGTGYSALQEWEACPAVDLLTTKASVHTCMHHFFFVWFCRPVTINNLITHICYYKWGQCARDPRMSMSIYQIFPRFLPPRSEVRFLSDFLCLCVI